MTLPSLWRIVRVRHAVQLGLALLALALLITLAGCVPPRVHPQPLRPLLCAQGWPLHGPHHHACGRLAR